MMKKDVQKTRSAKYKITSRVFTYVGDLRVSFSCTNVNHKTIQKALDILKPCDVVLTGTYYTFSRTAIPGSFTHALLYEGGERSIEALSEGVNRYYVANSLAHSDYFVILRPKLTDEQKKIVLRQAEELIGNDYGFGFDFVEGDQLTVCTEVIMRAFKGFVNFELKDGILSADQIYDHNKMGLMYESPEVENKNYLHKDMYLFAIFMFVFGLFAWFKYKRANRGK